MSAALVNAILDRVIEARALEDAALARGDATKARLALAARRLIERGGDPGSAEQLFVQAFRDLVLAETLRSCPAALELARKHLVAEAKAVLEVGPEALRKIPALKKADRERREAERGGA